MQLRIKHHHMPGDIPKQDKIEMLEYSPYALNRTETFSGEPLRDKRGYKNLIRMKERAVLKERFRKRLSQDVDIA